VAVLLLPPLALPQEPGDSRTAQPEDKADSLLAKQQALFDRLVDHGVKVINISGGLKRSLCPSAEKWKKLEDAFAYAAAKGVALVLAAGNNAVQWEDYPGSPDSVIVVGATLLNDTRWEEEVTFQGAKIKQGSNFGKRLTVMAPVEKLVVCAPHEQRFYACDDGPVGRPGCRSRGRTRSYATGPRRRRLRSSHPW
jgi:subtilisin family serine protease